jgi:hypothetical protein
MKLKMSMNGRTYSYGGEYQDIDGNDVERTRDKYPYSYDAYVTYMNGSKEDIKDSVYSDRILQWDYELTRKIMLEVFGTDGDYYNNRSPEDIEVFLRKRFDKPDLNLIAIMEGCNVGNGYPYWVFCYNEEGDK